MSYFCHQRINFQLQLTVNLAPACPIRNPWRVKVALLVKRPPNQCCSVAQSCLIRCDPIDCSMPSFPVHHHLSELAQTYAHRSWWCHPTISSSVVPFSSCLQSFPASGSFLMNPLFASGGQSIGASASSSVLPMNIQDWFPLRLLGLISLQSEGLCCCC